MRNRKCSVAELTVGANSPLYSGRCPDPRILSCLDTRKYAKKIKAGTLADLLRLASGKKKTRLRLKQLFFLVLRFAKKVPAYEFLCRIKNG